MRSQKMTLEVTLRGEGVVPAVTSSHPGGLLDFGFVLEKESASQVLKVSQQSADYLGALEEAAALELTLSPVSPAAAEQLSSGSGFQGAAGQPLSLQASGWS